MLAIASGALCFECGGCCCFDHVLVYDCVYILCVCVSVCAYVFLISILNVEYAFDLFM